MPTNSARELDPARLKLAIEAWSRELESGNSLSAAILAYLQSGPERAAEEMLAGPIVEIAAERRRQITDENWTAEHDDAHRDGEIAKAAAAYARHAGSSEDERQINSGFYPEDLWPASWALFWKPHSRRRDLIKAGALILAEIDRLDRAAIAAAQEPKP